MATQEASGTQAATVGTEHTLATLTGGKTYALKVDIAALAAGEYVELRVKHKVLSGGTSRTVFSGIYSWADALENGIALSPPSMAPVEYVATLKQINGTGRSFPWAVEAP